MSKLIVEDASALVPIPWHQVLSINDVYGWDGDDLHVIGTDHYALDHAYEAQYRPENVHHANQ